MFNSFYKILEDLEEYKLNQIEKIKDELTAKGEKLIDLSIGAPDLPPPPELISALFEAVHEPKNNAYPPYQGLKTLRVAIADYMYRRFGVTVDPELEILILIGSKEGIYHLPFVVLNENEHALIPDPSYPVYRNSLVLRNAKFTTYYLTENNGFQPNINSHILKNIKLLYLNSPNNPLGNCIKDEILEELLAYAKKYNFLIANDNAYCEIVYNKKPSSILQFDKGKTNVIEFHSFSKSLNISGWRLGWVCGNKFVIKNMLKQKAHMDSGAFPAIQLAVAKIMPMLENITYKIRNIYKNRIDLIYPVIRKKYKSFEPESTFYVWFKTPYDSEEFVKNTLKTKKIILCPSTAFSEKERNWARISLTCDENNIKKVANIFSDNTISYS